MGGNEKDYRSNYQITKFVSIWPSLFLVRLRTAVAAFLLLKTDCVLWLGRKFQIIHTTNNTNSPLLLLPTVTKILANLRNRFWLLPINKVEKILTIRVSARWYACLIILALSFGTSKSQIMSYDKRYGTCQYKKGFRFVLVRVRSCSFRGGFLP